MAADELIFRLIVKDEGSKKLGAFEKKLKSISKLADLDMSKGIEKTSKAFLKFTTNLGFAVDVFQEITPAVILMADDLKQLAIQALLASKVFQELQVAAGKFSKTLDKQESTKKAIKETKKLADAKKEAKSATNSLASRIRGFYSKELIELRLKLRKAALEFVGIENNLKGLGRAFGVFGKLALGALGAVGSAISGLVSGLKKVVGIITDEFKAAFKSSVSLEDALSGARRTANLTDDQMVILTKSVRDLSSQELQGAVSAEKLGEILEAAGQQGLLSGQDFENSLKATLEFTKDVAMASAALDLSFGKTAQSLGTIKGAFEGSKTTVGEMANSFNVLADSTRASAPVMIEMAKRIAPALAPFRIAMGDMIGFTGAMSSMGISSEEAATALKGSFQVMARDTDAFAEAFGINTSEFNRLVQTDIGGAMELFLQSVQKMATETPEGIQIVSQNLKDLGLAGSGVSTAILGMANMGAKLQSDFLDPANKGLESMDSVTAEFINNITKFSQLWSALGVIWTNTSGTVTDQLLPGLKELLKHIVTGAQEFQKWMAAQGFIDQIRESLLALVQLDIIPFIKEFTNLAKESGIIQKFFQESIPSGIASTKLALVGLISSFRVFISSIQEGNTVWESLLLAFPKLKNFEEQLKSTWKSFKDIVDIFKEAGAALKKADLDWHDFFMTVDAGMGFLKDFIGLIKDIVNPLDTASKVAGKLGDAIGSLWQNQDKLRFTSKHAKEEIEDGTRAMEEQEYQLEGASLTPALKRYGAQAIQSGMDSAQLTNQINSVSSSALMADSNISSMGASLGKASQAMSTGVNQQMLALSNSGLSSSMIASIQGGLSKRQPQNAPTLPTPSKAITSRTSSVATVGGQQTGGQRPASSPTIIFQGTNVIDESSKERFIRQISSGLASKSTRRIAA